MISFSLICLAFVGILLILLFIGWILLTGKYNLSDDVNFILLMVLIWGHVPLIGIGVKLYEKANELDNKARIEIKEQK